MNWNEERAVRLDEREKVLNHLRRQLDFVSADVWDAITVGLDAPSGAAPPLTCSYACTECPLPCAMPASPHPFRDCLCAYHLKREPAEAPLTCETKCRGWCAMLPCTCPPLSPPAPLPGSPGRPESALTEGTGKPSPSPPGADEGPRVPPEKGDVWRCVLREYTFTGDVTGNGSPRCIWPDGARGRWWLEAFTDGTLTFVRRSASPDTGER